MERFLSLIEVQQMLECSYMQATNRLAKAGILVVSPKKGAYLDKVLASFPGTQAPKIDPFKYPAPVGLFVTKKELIANFPLFNGTVGHCDDINMALHYGEYRRKTSGGVRTYSLGDFLSANSWPSPAEKSFLWFAFSTSAIVGKPTATQEKARAMAYSWAWHLKEKRLGIERATKKIDPEKFLKDFEASRTAVYEREELWNTHPELTVLGAPLCL